jgi:hypothetical protein
MRRSSNCSSRRKKEEACDKVSATRFRGCAGCSQRECGIANAVGERRGRLNGRLQSVRSGQSLSWSGSCSALLNHARYRLQYRYHTIVVWARGEADIEFASDYLSARSRDISVVRHCDIGFTVRARYVCLYRRPQRLEEKKQPGHVKAEPGSAPVSA